MIWGDDVPDDAPRSPWGSIILLIMMLCGLVLLAVIGH